MTRWWQLVVAVLAVMVAFLGAPLTGAIAAAAAADSTACADDAGPTRGHDTHRTYDCRPPATTYDSTTYLCVLDGPPPGTAPPRGAAKPVVTCDYEGTTLLSQTDSGAATERSTRVIDGDRWLISGAVVAANGGANAVRLGQAGENAVRGLYDIGPKATAQIGGRTRIFDGLNDVAVSEVKNVARQSYTQQLRDSLAYAQSTGRQFDLYVRPDTYLTGPLRDAIGNGDIVLRFIP
jgi:hypothetical protein